MRNNEEDFKTQKQSARNATDALKHCAAIVATVLSALIIVVVVCSWVVAAVMPELSIRSVISTDGIRWVYGALTDSLASEVLVWLLMLSASYGVCVKSRVINAVGHWSRLHFRERSALRLVLFEIILYAVILFFLAFVPHAPLLNVSGELFPSCFSESIVMQISFVLCLVSITYGVMTETFKSAYDIFCALTYGIEHFSSLYIIYILGAFLLFSLRFIAML